MRTIFGPFTLAVVGLLLACNQTNGGEGSHTQNMAADTGQAADTGTVTILIQVDTAANRFSYQVEAATGLFTGLVGRPANPIHAWPGARIRWKSDQGAWAVHHGPLTPFRQLAVFGDREQAVGAQIRPDAMWGKYPYFVAVVIDGRVWTDDPEDVVGPKPGSK